MSNEDAIRIVGRRVKALRKQQGLSQEKLAEKVGKSVDAISSIERGVSMPMLETAYALSEALGVRFFDLFREESQALEVEALPADVQELVHLVREQPEAVRQTVLEQARATVELVSTLTGKKPPK
ncbi:MAG: helix-turn-helix domain-containing protein [Solirubrobacterales bacterium]